VAEPDWKARAKTPEARARKAAAERRRRADPEGRKGVAAAKKRYHDKSRKRNRVHVRVMRAVKNGLLERLPCAVCGSASVEAHHDDYDRPLEVRWLCKVHHKEWHAANGEGANAYDLEERPAPSPPVPESAAVGRRYGKLTLVGRASPRSWHCLCDCGEKRVYGDSMLFRGALKSCGCARKAVWVAARELRAAIAEVKNG